MKIIKMLFLFLVSVIMLVPAVGCGGVEYEAIELVPEGTDMIAGIKVSEVISWWQLYSATEQGKDMSEQVEEAISEFTEQIGVDPRNVSEVLIFTDMSAADSEEYSGVIMTGEFGEVDIVDQIKTETGLDFTTDEYCGYTYYVAPDDEGAFMALNDRMIITGSVDAVKDCIDVIAGKKEKVSGAVLDTYNSLDDVAVKMAMVVPEETRETIAEEPEGAMMPVAMEAFEDIQTVGLALDVDEMIMKVRVNAGFSNPESAGKAAEALETMIDFFAMMSTEEETAELVDRIEITSSGSRMYILFDISLLELGEMAESYREGMGTPPMPFVPPDMGDFPDMEDFFDMEDLADDMPEIPEPD